MARWCGRVLVLGSANSSNSRRLVETAREAGAEATLVGSVSALAGQVWPDNIHVGLTSGASTPEFFLDEVVAYLQEREGFGVPGRVEVPSEGTQRNVQKSEWEER